ncbi:TPA: hypothetical protein ACH3X2_010579 [Trebouxia sp. C0005]
MLRLSGNLVRPGGSQQCAGDMCLKQICMMLLVVFLSADGSQSCCGCDVAVRLNFGPTHSLTHSAQSCCCYFSKGGNEPWPWVMHYGSSATVISDEDEPVE